MQFFLKKFHCLYFLSYLCTDEKRTASDGIVLSRQGKLKKTTFVSLENITIKKVYYRLEGYTFSHEIRKQNTMS